MDPETRRHLAGRLWVIPGRRGGHYPHCNSLWIDSGERAVIDPGSNRRELRSLAQAGVGAVFLSHHHSDHVRDLKELPGARILVHSVEKAAVESFDGASPLIWFPDETRDPIWQRRKENEVGGWGWPVAGTFGHGDEYTVGEVRFQVIHTPGHTPGHCCFWFPAERVLFSADVDLTDFGPWYGNAGSDLEDFRESISRLAEYNPALTVTGHEAGVIEGDLRERLKQYAARIEERHQKILAFLSRPRTEDEITKQGFIYGPAYSTDNTIYYGEFRMVRHHLRLALKQGQARTDGKTYVV